MSDMHEETNYFQDFLLTSGDLADIANTLFMQTSETQDETHHHASLQNLILAHIMLHLCRLNDKLDTLIERQVEIEVKE